MVIPIISSDRIVWDRDDVVTQLVSALQNNEEIILDLNSEGPDFTTLGIMPLIHSLCALYNRNVNQITLRTSNVIEQNLPYNVNRHAPMHFVTNTRKLLHHTNASKEITNTFGIFIGRSNLYRLKLSSYVWKYYSNKTQQTFHYSLNDEYFNNNIGIEAFINNVNSLDLGDMVNFLQHCPFTHEPVTYPLLMDQHCNISDQYRSFFVELVCETYFSGNTFFPTEKTWRPIMLKTPFIVQGPPFFLHRLRQLGFKTFESFWDEGYSEDPPNHQLFEIIRVIDYLAKFSNNELQEMYKSMSDIIEHNYNQLLTLKEDNFLNVK